MKCYLFAIFFGVFLSLHAQDNNQSNSQVDIPTSDSKSLIKKVDSTLCEINSNIEYNSQLLEDIDVDLSLKQRFKLYKTENIYNFLKLDSRTGKIYQVQWSLDKNKEFITTINSENLSNSNSCGSNSFELYPTNNMYQFLLMDKTDGRMWHVQWGMENNNRWIRRIY